MSSTSHWRAFLIFQLLISLLDGDLLCHMRALLANTTKIRTPTTRCHFSIPDVSSLLCTCIHHQFKAEHLFTRFLSDLSKFF